MSSEPDKPPGDGESPPAAGESGSIEVAVSGAHPAAESGSIEVAMSGAHPAAESGSIEVAMSGAHPVSQADAVPVPVSAMDSAPISSGKVVAVAPANEPTERRSKRLTDAAKDALGGGVTRLGTGLGTLGEGVTRLGERSKKLPLVGQSVSILGEGLTSVGESLTELPRVAATRRGRLLVRSLVVGFVLVAAWISVIVALQVRGTDTPDFRPNAHRILFALGIGGASIEEVYESASPRFQEMVGKERFVSDMTDLNKTLGKFIEITAVNDTLVTTGPTGRIGRVSLTVAYEKGKCKASVSLHYDEGVWKLLGVGVELPPELKISQAERQERVQACRDPMDAKRCDVFVAANAILEQLRDGHAGEVWDAATRVFQTQEAKSKFIQIQGEHKEILGDYRRIIAVTEAKMFGGTNATFDVLVEYAKSQGVRAIFGFYRRSSEDAWKLRSLKVVLPMPRVDDPHRSVSDAAPRSPGAASASGGSARPPVGGTSGSGSSRAGSGSAAPTGSAKPPKNKGSAAPAATTPPRPSGASTGSAPPPMVGSAGSASRAGSGSAQ